MLEIVVLLIVIGKCGAGGGGVIKHLSESEYARLPPLFHLDPYKECIDEGGEYCSLRMKLVSDHPSSLLKIIEQYSEHKTHFNHTVLNHGICISKTCKDFEANITRAPRDALEACMNSTLWRRYSLKAKLTAEPSCYRHGVNNETMGVLDVIIAVVLGVVLVLNVVGSLREFIISEKDNSFWSSFSLKRNWQILSGPPRVTDPRKEGMIAFNGIRSITSMLVICVHSFMPFVISSANPRAWEEGYTYMKYFATGAIIIQTFFVLSGFLMAYNMAAGEGERGESCLRVLHRILLRWLRLAPPYLVVLALTMTWLRFAGAAGPLWQMAVGDHVASCRRHWWLVPLNLINYVDHSQCFVEYWYIAADMQLSILGLAVVGLLRGRARWWTLGFLLAAGTIAPAAHTWLQDLDAWMLLTPETSRNFFVEDPTFNHVYKRGHTNVAAYVIGAAAGLLAWGWQGGPAAAGAGKKLQYTSRACRRAVRASVPLMCGAAAAGAALAEAGSARALRAAYSALGRLLFGAGAAALLAGLALRIDAAAAYGAALRWRGWVRPARLSYCAYALHVALLRLYAGSQATLTRVSAANTMCLFAGSLLASFLAAVPLWLLVEAPAAALLKRLTRRVQQREAAAAAADASGGVHAGDPRGTTRYIVEKL